MLLKSQRVTPSSLAAAAPINCTISPTLSERLGPRLGGRHHGLHDSSALSSVVSVVEVARGWLTGTRRRSIGGMEGLRLPTPQPELEVIRFRFVKF